MRQTTTILTLISIVTLFSCDKSTSDKKTLDFGNFEIEVPKTWEKVSQQGIDSYVGQIAIDDQDTLEFDLGWYSNDLEDEEPIYKIEDKKIFVLNKKESTPSSRVFEYAGHVDSVDFEELIPTTIEWTTINNRKAKLVKPRNPGHGTTGVYFDSLWTSGSDVDRFQLSGQYLKPENELKVLTAIRTLKFKSE